MVRERVDRRVVPQQRRVERQAEPGLELADEVTASTDAMPYDANGSRLSTRSAARPVDLGDLGDEPIADLLLGWLLG